ncbi:MAG: GNAT family N-acetyltransferase [Gammaproteobacteria bacterium]|nr:GNAT family N-acetyltransferase [Gammaproteobacteria bacterium]
MQITVKLSVFSSFEELQPSWTAFESECDCYAFQSYNWLSNWHNDIGTKLNIDALLVLVELPAGTPLMILPLGIQKRGFARSLIWLGGNITDYQGPLLCKNFSSLVNADQFTGLWKKILAELPQLDAICLERQPKSMAVQPNPFIFPSCIQHASSAHQALLSDNYEGFVKQRRGSKWISTERRKQKRLEERGKLVFEVAQTEAEINLFLDAMISQKSESYKILGVRNLFSQAGYPDFFQHLSDQHAGDAFVHLSALRLDGQIIATHWGLVYKKRFYHLLPSYSHDEYTRFSPGNILLRKLFEWCIQNGIEVYDFTVGDESYKLLWSGQNLELFDYYKAKNLKGIFYIFPLKLIKKLKRSIKQQPRILKLAYQTRMLIARAGRRLGQDKKR